MGKRSSKCELLDFIHQAAAESTITPSLVVTDGIVKKLKFYQNINKEGYLSSILKDD